MVEETIEINQFEEMVGNSHQHDIITQLIETNLRNRAQNNDITLREPDEELQPEVFLLFITNFTWSFLMRKYFRTD